MLVISTQEDKKKARWVELTVKGETFRVCAYRKKDFYEKGDVKTTQVCLAVDAPKELVGVKKTDEYMVSWKNLEK